MKCEIVKRINLKDIPSASGIEKFENHFYIIGDNSPWYFKLNERFETVSKYKIGKEDVTDETIPKKLKKDLEALTLYQFKGVTYLFILGSGSKYNHRKVGKIVDLNNQNTVDYDLTEFFDLVMDQAKINEDEFNIEGATVLDNHLFLFNRGKNKVISMKLETLMDFLEGRRDDIKMKVKSVDLPEINGIVAGFSGATTDSKRHRIIFTASVENTSNTIDDGEVLGSFIGIMDPELLHQHYAPDCFLITENSTGDKVKVESVVVNRYFEGGVECYLVTDSDGSESELLEVQLID